MSEPDDVVRELLIAALDDWIYLAQMGSIVRDVLKIEGPWVSPETQHQIREATCAAIARMLTSGLIRVGTLNGSRFVPWNLDAEKIVERITSEWKELGQISLGDICWAEITMPGKEVGRELFSSVGSSLDDDEP